MRKGGKTTTNRPVLPAVETPNGVCDPMARKALKILENIEKQSEKIAEKSFKKVLQWGYLFYILIGLVKCEEVGSYRASG